MNLFSRFFIIFFICGVNSTSLVCSNNISWLLNVCPDNDIPPKETEILSEISVNTTSSGDNDTLSANKEANKTTSVLNDSSTVIGKKLAGDLRASDDEPQIASFDEWTTQKLLEHQTKVADNKNGVSSSGGNVVPPMAARNYASKECGAKVLLANPEAQNAGAVLNEKERDEYMLNPCNTEGQKWFVVELCETIQITKIEIANFELFSSRPKDVKVWSSERYPSPEWTLLGSWVAEDKRELQSFDVKNRLYAKYLKVELLSHYGTEHFCPLSLLRVLGVSMVEEYENEALSQEQPSKAVTDSDTHNNESIVNINVSSATVNETLATNLTTASSTTVPHGGSDYFMESAKKAVVLIAKEMYGKAHSVFIGGKPSPSIEHEPIKNDTFISNKSAYYNSSSVTFCVYEPIVWSDCIKCRKNFSDVPKICGYYLVLTSSSSSSSSSPSLPSSNGIFAFLVNPNVNRVSSLVTPIVNRVSSSADLPTEDQYPNVDEKIDFDDYDPSIPLEIFTTLPIPVPFDFGTKTESLDNKIESTVSQPTDSIEDNATTTTPTVHSDISPTNEMTRESPSAEAPATPPPASPATSLPGVATSTKESVFVRLNNRIKMLELNISLSSQYLSELSKKYRKQMEDIQKAFNKTSQLFNETDSKFEDSLKRQVHELEVLKEEVAGMKPMMSMLVKDYVLLQSEAMHWVSIFVFIEVVVVVAVLWCCFGRRSAKANLHMTREELEILIEKAVTKRIDDLFRLNNFQHVGNNRSEKRKLADVEMNLENGNSVIDLAYSGSTTDVQILNKKKKMKKKHQHKLSNGSNSVINVNNTDTACGQISTRKCSDQTCSYSTVSSTTPSAVDLENKSSQISCSSAAGLLFTLSPAAKNEGGVQQEPSSSSSSSNWTKVLYKPASRVQSKNSLLDRRKSSESDEKPPAGLSSFCLTNLLKLRNSFDVLNPDDRKRYSSSAERSRAFS